MREKEEELWDIFSELNVEMYRERQQRRHEEESWLRQQVFSII